MPYRETEIYLGQIGCHRETEIYLGQIRCHRETEIYLGQRSDAIGRQKEVDPQHAIFGLPKL
jgi:hypothetical protein